ncbi:MAG TPA: PKD domain-containing protein, partial [Bacteroidia bacterium]|nr:PKD domain-containing protein [Bacteroidia bacterium]
MKYTLTTLLFLWVFLCVNPARGNPESTPPENYPTAEASEYAPPAVGFTYNTSGGCVPVIVQFYSQMAGPTYNWTFGDGGTSTQCNPVYVYTVPGTYVVTLNATGGTYQDTIVVGDTPVVTLTTGDLVTCLGATETYTVSSTIPPAQYSWSVQGGQVIGSPTATTVTIKWDTYGLNYINYTITTAQGCTKIFRFAIKVIPPPTVNLPCCEKRPNEDGTKRNVGEPGHEGVPGGSEPCDVCANSYSCYQGFINPDFGLASDYTWQWSVTNGVIDTISGDSTRACVIWGASGTGTIKLILTHKIYGCQTVKECEVTIKPGINPVFSVSGACVNWPVNFDASATTPLADIESYFWEFGDGYTETTAGPSASHQYSFTGTYTATLTITTKEGCTYKVEKTFNVISGTRPIIACPGTICKGSRACYSTALISGATYVWNIVGDDPSQQTISSDGNEICVTWGNGPVGTVTVTVLNGGYTCTNTSTEVVAIVDQVIPIAGPDYICNTTGFVEVSTANYAGACYRWTVNGTPQSALTNVLQFNAQAYSNPIDIKVEVNFGLGCCHGAGQKQIFKLPEYTMAPYNGNVCVGSTQTYFLIFPAGPPSSNVSWSVEGGTVVTSGPNFVQVNWTTVGGGSITAGNNTPSEYCNDGSNNTWNVTVWDKATGEDIAGPQLVCADGTTSYTYYHGYEYPTGSATISVSPAGATVTPGTYSSGIKFNAPGTYTISVTYNHSVVTPCPSTKTYVVKAVSPSIPAFTLPPGNVCKDDIKTYTASMSDPNDYEWSVIGGAIVSESWAAGTLTLQIQWNSTVNSSITVTNKACGTSASQTITVHGRPVVIITAEDVVCGVTSRKLSVANAWNTYSWGPGVTPGPNPYEGSVSSPGTYSITVTNNFCPNTGSITVSTISPAPPNITGFVKTPPPTNLCPEVYTICPTVVPGSGSIVSYTWSFNGFNITTSTAQCPAVYLNQGAGVLTTGTWFLTVEDSYGCKDTMSGGYTDSCSANGGGGGTGTPCTSNAVFNATYDPCTGLFTPTPGSINYTSVYWNFGDNTSGSGSSPTHLYETCGNKNVVAYVADNQTPPCWKAVSIPTSVPYVFFNPQIVVNNAPCVGTGSITASGLSICDATLIPSYSWTVTGTWGTYTAVTATDVLNVGTISAIGNGNNNVSVDVTIAGCTKTITGSFVKGGLEAFFLNCGGCAGSPLSFIDQSVPFGVPIIKWNWQITGPPNYTSELQNPTIDFTVANSYSVTLTVTDNNLCTDSYNTSIVIN